MTTGSQAPMTFQIPRGILYGMWGLVGFAIAATAAWRIAGIAPEGSSARALLVQDLVVTDGGDGSVRITDPGSGRVIDTLEPGTSGFVRATLRGLARERRLQGAGSEAAFRLTRWSDGHLTLADTSTGRLIDLGAFGITNAQAFARLIPSQASSQSGPAVTRPIQTGETRP